MIVLKNIDKTYHTGLIEVHALKGVSLTVRRGEFTAVMGPSGSGKSTLMNIIGLLDRPSAGAYILDGVSADKLEDDELAILRNQKIGFVFQNFNLLPRLSALRNVELPLLYSGVGAGERRRRAADALARVGLGSHMEHRPNELSGGQKQRVAIARALINAPPLLVADEPTGNLDSGSGYEIIDLFQELHTLGSTILIVTHEPEIARHTQKIIYFRDGRLVKNEIVAEPCSAKESLKQWVLETPREGDLL